MSKAKPESFSPYFATSDAGQVRAAFAAAGHLEGYASISELIEAGSSAPDKLTGTLSEWENTRAQTDALQAAGYDVKVADV